MFKTVEHNKQKLEEVTKSIKNLEEMIKKNVINTKFVAEEIVIDFNDYDSKPINVSMVPSDDGKYKIFDGGFEFRVVK